MSMNRRGLATVACALLSSSCYVLGIDFDKTGVTSSSSSGGAGGGAVTTTTGTAGGGPGSGGAGGSSPAPDCGGVDLLTDLANSPYYRTNGTLAANTCDSIWNGMSNTAKLALPAAATGSCRLATNWDFDGRGRRYVAHLASAPPAIAKAPAGLFTLDTNGFEILALFHSDGSVWVSTRDIGTSTVKEVGPIDVGTDRIVSFRFSNDGGEVWLDSASQPDTWVERASVDLTPFATPFNASSLKVGLIQTGDATNVAGGSADFDSLHGETVPKSSKPAIACPASSLKASFNVAALPDTLVASTSCVVATGTLLRLCSTAAKPCVVSSRHLYDLSGSRVDVEVTNLSIDPGVALTFGAFPAAPPGPVAALAQMLLTPTTLQTGGAVLGAPTVPPATSLFLDIVDDGMGTVHFGTHASMGGQPSNVGTTALTAPAIAEIRLVVPSPHACVSIDNLGIP